MASHIDKVEAIIEQLRSMKSNLDDTFAVGSYMASIYTAELLPVMASIKAFDDFQITREATSSRLIEEAVQL